MLYIKYKYYFIKQILGSKKIFYISLFSFFFLFLFIFYNFIFGGINYNIYEIAGSLPMYPNIYFKNSFLSDWELYSPFGSQGRGLLYSVFYYLIQSIFKSNYISERVWLISLLLLGTLSFSLLARRFTTNNYINLLFSLSFGFSSIVTNMVVSGAYMILTLYSSIPLLILLMMSFLDEKNILSTRFLNSLLFSIVLSISYEFNPGAIMWIPVLLVITIFIIFIISKFNVRFIIKSTFFSLLSLIVFLFLTNSTSILSLVIKGNTLEYFSSSDFGASSIQNILTDMTTNFNGWLSFQYWYFAIIMVSILCLLFGYFSIKKIATNLYANSIFISSVIQIVLILSIWGIFHYSIYSIEYVLAKYAPFLEEYIPHMGYVLISGFFILDSLILISYFEGGQKKFFNRTVYKQNYVIFHKKRIIYLVSIAILILCLISPINMNTNFPQHYSTIQMIYGSKTFTNDNKIPEYTGNVSNWFKENTNLQEDYRVLFFPYEVSTDNDILKDMPWTYYINITNNAYSSLNNFIIYNNSKGFSVYLAESDVEYLIINFGPYVGTDNVNNSLGNPRFQQSGYSWETAWNPLGSPSKWAKKFNSSKFFDLVGNLGNVLVYRNNLYKGDIVYYTISNTSYSYLKDNVIYPEQYNCFTSSLLVNSNVRTKIPSWISNSGNLTTITGNPGNQSIFQTNKVKFEKVATAHTVLNLYHDSYYFMKYEVNLNNSIGSWFIIYFYQNDTLVSPFGTNTEPGVVWYAKNNLITYNTVLFKTPKIFNKVIICEIVNFNDSRQVRNSYTKFSNITINQVNSFNPKSLNYSEVNSSTYKIKSEIRNNSLIQLLTSYSNYWQLLQDNRYVSSSVSIELGYPASNYFFINKSYGNESYELFFIPQTTYSYYLLLWEIEWTSIIIGTLIMGFFNFVYLRKKIDRR